MSSLEAWLLVSNNITQAHPPCNVWDLTYIKTHIFAIYYHISSTHNNIWYTSPTWTFFATVTIPFVWRSHFPPRNVDQPFSLWEEAKAGGTKSSCPGNRVHGLETYQQNIISPTSPLKLALEVGGSHFAQNLVQNENHHHKFVALGPGGLRF